MDYAGCQAPIFLLYRRRFSYISYIFGDLLYIGVPPIFQGLIAVFQQNIPVICRLLSLFLEFFPDFFLLFYFFSVLVMLVICKMLTEKENTFGCDFSVMYWTSLWGRFYCTDTSRFYCRSTTNLLHLSFFTAQVVFFRSLIFLAER